MQLIVGCRARGASWAGSETLVIPGNRLTIHIHVRTHAHVHVYWFRMACVSRCIYWVNPRHRTVLRATARMKIRGARDLDERAQNLSMLESARVTSTSIEANAEIVIVIVIVRWTPCTLKYILTNTKRIGRTYTDAHRRHRCGELFNGVTCLRTPDLLCRL